MITISLNLDANLKRHLKTKNEIVEINVEEGTTIKQLFDKIGIIPGEVGIIKLDDKVVREHETLFNDCMIQAFQIFGGG